MAQQASRQPGRNDPYDGSRKRETGPTYEPEQKRRRLQEPGDDDGEWDDIGLTQHDLDTLDVIASQAANEPGGHGVETRSTEPEKTLPLGGDISAIAEGRNLFQVPGPSGAVQLKTKSSTSSSSESVYPNSSVSLSKTSSSAASSAAGSLTSTQSSSFRSSSDKSVDDVSNLTRTGSSLAAAAAMKKELTKKVEETYKLQAELTRAKKEVYARDGEVQFLRGSLHKQEAELEKLRADREERKEKEDEQKKQKEQELRAENERLQTQIQFLTQDSQRLKDRYQAMEQRLHQLETSPLASSTAAGPATSTPISPSKSPRLKTVAVSNGGGRTPQRGGFPSRKSFMAGPGDAESTSASRTVQTKGTMTTEADAPHMSQPMLSQRLLGLSVSSSKGQTSGPGIVSQLLQCSCAASGEVEDSGIVGLMQMIPSRLDLSELHYKRDQSTLRLSPIKKIKSGELCQQASVTYTASKPIVGKENFLLAVQGLRNLVESPHRQGRELEVDLTSKTNESEESHINQDNISFNQPEGTLFLPLLNDYLGQYMDILTRDPTGGAASPSLLSSDSSKSSSVESSLESLTSSLGLLLSEEADYANNMETLGLCALRVLYKLVCLCPDVQSACLGTGQQHYFLQCFEDINSSPIESDQENDQMAENSSAESSDSGLEGDDERSSSSSSMSSQLFTSETSRSSAASLQGLNILHKLVRLATPNSEGSGFNARIVQEALHILTVLAESSSDADVERLNLVILRGVLTECLKLNQHLTIIVSALQLFTQLVRSHSGVLFLCTKSENCTLLHIHLVIIDCLRVAGSTDPVQTRKVIDQFITSLSAMVTHHRNGVTLLLDNDCQCSRQMMTSLVYALFHVLQEYQTSLDPTVLGTLHRGVILLYNISVKDTSYQFHSNVVGQCYTGLMCGLSRIYQATSEIPQDEVSMLLDLWDDTDESDSDQEDRMDTQ